MSVTSKISKPSLRRFDFEALVRIGPLETVRRGRLYYAQGRATVEHADDEKATIQVDGSQEYPYEVNVWLDDLYPERRVHAQCDCPHAENQPGVMCKHKVAGFLALYHYYRTQRKVHWADMMQRVLEAAEIPQKSRAESIVFFNLLNWGGRYQIHPYMLPVKSFTDAAIGDRDAMAAEILRMGLGRKARRVQGTRGLGKAVSASPGEIAAAGMLADSWRYYSDMSLNVVLPLLTDSIVLTGNHNAELKKQVRVSTAPEHLDLEIQRQDGDLKMIASLSFQGAKLPLTSIRPQIIEKSPMWLLTESTVFPVEGEFALVETFLKHPEIVIPEADADRFVDEYLLPIVERVSVKLDGVGEWRDVSAERSPSILEGVSRRVGGRASVRLRHIRGDV